MKLCFLGDAITHHMRRWTKFFAGRGHEVHVLTLHDEVLPNYDPVRVEVIHKSFRGSGFIFRLLNLCPVLLGLKKRLAEINPDLLHCHDAGAYAWLAASAGFHPLMISAQGNDVLIYAKESRTARVLTKSALKRADLVHCDGYEMRDEIIKLGVNPQKIEIVFFGTDVCKFRPDRNGSHLKRGEGANGPVVISTRRLDPVHNIETLIRSVPYVLQDVPTAKFVIAGYGTEEEYLRNLVEELGVGGSVTFLGMIEENEMVRSLQMADVYVVTSLSESGIAASTAEAMACELPVVSTEVGDIRRWIKDGENGYVIPKRQPAVLAERVIHLVRNEQERKSLGKKNRRIIKEQNNYIIEMGKIEQIYERLALDSKARQD
jgi:glycosyltransferase involved in cell wall biosynthesis